MHDPQFAQTRISSPGSLDGWRWADEDDWSASTMCLEVAGIGGTIPIRQARRRCHADVGSSRGYPVFENDYYKILEVDPEADAEVIAAAYHVLAKVVRDKPDLDESDQIRLAELDLAFAVLSNPAQRRAFDARRTPDTVAVGPGYANGNGDVHAYDAAARLAAGPLSERLAAGLHGESLGELTINFGRYAGWTLSEIAASDPDYLQWLSRHSSGIRYRRAILRLLREREDAKSTLHVKGSS
jgi:curved DNA-binding protein CbpA